LKPHSAVLSGTVNPNGTTVTECLLTLEEHLAWLFNKAYGFELYLEAHPCTVAGTGNSPVPVESEFTGLIPNSEYIERLGAHTASGAGEETGEIKITTPPEAPQISEVATHAITRTSAVVQGVVASENSETSYYAVFGRTPAYGASTAPLAAGKFSVAKSVQLKIEGLKPGTTYHYKLVAVSEAGKTESEDGEFTTQATLPPSVSNVGIEELEPGAALIAGVVDTNGLPGSYEIDFGPTTSYATKAIGEVVERHERVTLNLIYLIPETTYHYRIVVRNEDGTAESADQTFTTPRYPLKIPQILPHVSALISGFPTAQATFPKEVKPTGNKHHKAKKHSKKHSKKHKKRGKHK
jgi:hypothetical protein